MTILRAEWDTNENYLLPPEGQCAAVTKHPYQGTCSSPARWEVTMIHPHQGIATLLLCALHARLARKRLYDAGEGIDVFWPKALKKG